MRILFVAPYVPSLIRVRPYHFVTELAKRHDVTVLATGSKRDLESAVQLRRLCAGLEFVPLRLTRGMASCAMAAVRGKPLQAAVCQSPELRRRVGELLHRNRFDVVHVEHLRAADLVNSIPSDVPTLFDAVDSISLLLERTLQASHSLRQRFIAHLELHRTRRFEAEVLRRFDQVITTAPDDARALQSLAPSTRISVVPNGVDLDYFRPANVPPEPATLVLSGKMSYHANVTAALHFAHNIWPLIHKSRPDARLRIVGAYPPRAVQALAQDPAISVTGYLPDVRAALAGATLAVCPVTVKVGIQNKVLEAMAMGLPVVCTSAGASGLAAQPGRDFLVAGTPEEFAEGVWRVLADSKLRDDLAQSGRRYVEKYHRWSAAVDQLDALYPEAREHSQRRDRTAAPISAK